MSRLAQMEQSLSHQRRAIQSPPPLPEYAAKLISNKSQTNLNNIPSCPCAYLSHLLSQSLSYHHSPVNHAWYCPECLQLVAAFKFI